MNIYWNLPWREEYRLENSSRRVFYWVIGVWIVQLIDEHIIWISISSWQRGRPVIIYWLGKVHDVVGITGDPRILVVVWTLRMSSVSSVRVSCVGSFRVGCGDSASRLSYGVTQGYIFLPGTSYFPSCLKAPRGFTILYPWGTPAPHTKRSIRFWPDFVLRWVTIRKLLDFSIEVSIFFLTISCSVSPGDHDRSRFGDLAWFSSYKPKTKWTNSLAQTICT